MMTVKEKSLTGLTDGHNERNSDGTQMNRNCVYKMVGTLQFMRAQFFPFARINGNYVQVAKY